MEEDIKKYISYLMYERRNAKNTYLSYKRDLNDYRLFMSQRNIYKTEEIKKEDVLTYLEFLSKENLTATSIARKLTAIKNFHNFLQAKDILSTNVTVSIERPKIVKKLYYKS